MHGDRPGLNLPEIAAERTAVGSLRSAGGAGRPLLTVQALRGIAALMVVCHHTLIMIDERITHRATPYWPGGAEGVDIFFVISGLVMMISSAKLVQAAHGARTFLLRRVERVVPLYWIATGFKLLLLLALPGLALHHLPNAGVLFCSFFFLPPTSYGSALPVLVVGWTLAYEMLFYVLFAAALALRLPLLRSLTLALVGITCLGLLLPPSGNSLRNLLSPIELEFLFGLWLGQSVLRRRLPSPAICIGLLVLGTAGVVAAANLQMLPWRELVCGIPALAIVTGAVGLEPELAPRLPRWLLHLGDISYSLYLTHGLLLPLAGAFFPQGKVYGVAGIMLVAALGILASIAGGEISYRVLEQPILHYFHGRRRPATPVTS